MLLYATLFAFSIECLKLVPPYLMKIAIDLLVETPHDLQLVLIAVSGVLIVSLLTTLIEDYFIRYCAHTTFFVEAEILKKAHRKLLSLDIRYHEAHPSGEIVHLMNSGSVRLRELMWFTQDQFIGATIQIVLTALVLLSMHFFAGVVFFAFMPLTLYLVYRSGQKVQPYRKQYHDVLRQATWKMNQSLFNVRTVKNYVQEDRELEEYRAMLEQYQDLADVRIRAENIDTRRRDMILGFGRFTVLLYAVYLVTQGEMTPGTLVLFATLSEKVIASLYRLGRLYSHLGDSVEAIDQFTTIFAAISEPCEGNLLQGESLSGEIRIRGATFSYEKDIPVIKDINLLIPSRSICAVVGPSGAGKSTLIKLLLRHYELDFGSIEFDGVDIKTLAISEYRKRIAVVSQDIEIFDASVHDNIAYGRQATRAEVEAVACSAYAHDFISELPQGYDTRVGERGVKLSGGQKQRIGIARALLMKPVVIIFDEATSSLDSQSEKMIQEALRAIARTQTMILIAHRLSTIAQADLIVVLNDGEIVEMGTHDQLMERRGLFMQMRKLQSLGEVRP
jgi:ABC-type multidrug transport system fused ATPase/permease subunit